jgi:dTDP-4-dehydrorhamnose reductase
MKILLTGKDGQIGRELQRALGQSGQVMALARADANLEDLVALQVLLQKERPDIIVNAAAYTAVDRAEQETALATRVNTDAVATMALYAHRTKALLVHYSTDYVFDGTKKSPYVENDTPNPLNVYGKSKRAGEQAIIDSGCDALIFRTSWVYAAHGSNFVKTMLKLAAERETLSIVADQHGAPTSAVLIADVTALAIVEHNRKVLPSGLYHLTAAGAASWYEFACYIVKRAHAQGMKLKLSPENIKPITTKEYPLPALRPTNSQLDCTALRQALKLQLPDWKRHVDATVDQLARMSVSS